MDAPHTHLSTFLCGEYQPLENPFRPNNPIRIPDIRDMVFSYLDPVTLALASRVCKAWHTAANEQKFWTALATRHKLSEASTKRSVLFNFRQHRGSKTIKNKDDLIAQVEAYFKKQKWNQTGKFSCQIGPKYDDTIVVEILRNAHVESYENPPNLHTTFYVDNGPQFPSQKQITVGPFKNTEREYNCDYGFSEYYIKMQTFISGHEGNYEAMVLLPTSQAKTFMPLLEKIAEATVQRLASEEENAKKNETILRASTLGLGYMVDSIYEGCYHSCPINGRLESKKHSTHLSL